MKEPERLFTSDPELARFRALLDRDMPAPGTLARSTARVLDQVSWDEEPSDADAARPRPSRSPWLVVGLGGLLLVTGMIARSPWRPAAQIGATPVTAAVAIPAEEPKANHVVDTPPEQPAVRVEDLPTASRPALAPPAAASADPFLEELALVERARAALGQGQGRECLEATRTYEKRFSKNGLFREEVAVMHIEALALSGDRSTARTLGQRFLGAHPNTPYTDRIERVLARSAD